jgi:hypothetical protein
MRLCVAVGLRSLFGTRSVSDCGFLDIATGRFQLMQGKCDS